VRSRASDPAGPAAQRPAGSSVRERRTGAPPRCSAPRAGFELERWDAGRLTVNRGFADVLSDAGLETFESLWSFAGGQVAKNVLRERTTTRIVLPDRRTGGDAAFYLKRHAPVPLKEYIKPLLRLRWPILGARNEWNAILQFHDAGLPTMTPVALGQCGHRSLLLTRAIEGCRKLSDLLAECAVSVGSRKRAPLRPGAVDAGSLIPRLARLARTMHAAGLHHQDFYLTHLLVPGQDDGETLYVIDLGRVRQRRRLARRWIVKDLAQLNYSAAGTSQAERQRFLEAYLGRPLEAADRHLIRRIERKTRAIGRHSRKNRL
jgi:heptose I phosphotransferase